MRDIFPAPKGCCRQYVTYCIRLLNPLSPTTNSAMTVRSCKLFFSYQLPLASLVELYVADIQSFAIKRVGYCGRARSGSDAFASMQSHCDVRIPE